jgi:predicted nucleic acid-binding protein
VARALVLDAEALHALARARERGTLTQRARAVLQVAHEEQALVRVPAPVLAEVCRGGLGDALISRALNGRGIVVVDLTASAARRAGALLARIGLGSTHAVDAFVVATAPELGPSVIATGDPDDLRRLAAGSQNLRIIAI